ILAIVSCRKVNYICRYFNNRIFTLTLINLCLGIYIAQAEDEELYVAYTPERCSERLGFGIEGFC
ncbi:MAG: hypothetical protein K2I25_07310, partial [Muribaculaceae bacterium]|nr:hypothetical protein [Muribaculaceae bacterium]